MQPLHAVIWRFIRWKSQRLSVLESPFIFLASITSHPLPGLRRPLRRNMIPRVGLMLNKNSFGDLFAVS